ncbi:MAG TPA: MAPEG family protein [Stellaceae bacterium]|nr:MAPEG family protein [Stellaceae bacterium]
MPFKITALYAGINGLILLVLAIRVARQRGISKVGLGTGGDSVLERAVRIHGNAAESIPIILILLGLAEACGSKPWLLHGMGIALTLGRLLHIWGLTQSSGTSFGRVAGMSLTWLALAVGAIRAVVYGLSQF